MKKLNKWIIVTRKKIMMIKKKIELVKKILNSLTLTWNFFPKNYFIQLYKLIKTNYSRYEYFSLGSSAQLRPIVMPPAAAAADAVLK